MLTKKISPALFSMVVVVALLFAMLLVGRANADITTNTPSITPNTFQTYTFFATSTVQTVFSTSTSATSTSITSWFNSRGELDTGAFNVAGANKVTFYFSRAGAAGNEGSSRFEVEVTPDGTNWYDFNKLVQNLATSTDITTLSTITVTGTSTVIASMDLSHDTFKAVRAIVVETTDGEHSVKASADF